MTTTYPTHAEKFATAYTASRDRAKAYALADTTLQPFDHLLKVRVLTLFRPKYGLSLDLLLLFVGGVIFGGWGYIVAFLVGSGLTFYWAKEGTKFITLGFAEFLGNCLGFAVGITTPRRKIQAAFPQAGTQSSPKSPKA